MAQTTRRPFGRTPAGEEVELLTLNNGVLACEVISYGASIRALYTPDRNGKRVDVVLGYEDLTEYLKEGGHLGAVVGRYANRIAGGHFSLDGKDYTLFRNNGPNHLHGGKQGFSKRVWKVESVGENEAVLSMDSPDMDAGYPGHLTARITYRLEGNALVLDYQADTDRNTVCNLTNHAYFNLSGQESGEVLGQEISLNCSKYTPADRTGIPTGEVADVEGTPMDLRRPTLLGAHIRDEFQQIAQFGGYDHNFIIDGQPGTLRPAARAKSYVTGIVMEVETDQPAVQLYTANSLSVRPGKEGASYSAFHAFCLETQNYPDAPNRPEFPSAVLAPGKPYRTTTRFIFTAEE